MLKLLVVEDHALVREGLVGLLSQIEEGASVFESADFESALGVLDSEGDFDLVLLDLALPGIDGFAGLDILRRRYPAMPVAVVSAFDDMPTVTRVINLGASGFIPKALNGECLLQAVREVLAGNIFRPSGQALARMDDAVPVPPSSVSVRPEDIGLTDRQAQVLCLMVRGLSNRDIAEQLDLSEGTVKIHATAVFKALGVNSRTQALVTAARYRIDFADVF
ncbi:DNA-binding response regulator [Azonexus hydrophilus]|uniref:DNA-binding response regulator n=1 Tax=Azonexus hydrophilus TaxID=418702 RepID=A0A1R1ICN6_9RHOO|nr:response regulator transcription factor [Azonexus hydrophilus]OMG56410.1 DNA-binding response regulator [Azonexus hydrophilus]